MSNSSKKKLLLLLIVIVHVTDVSTSCKTTGLKVTCKDEFAGQDISLIAQVRSCTNVLVAIDIEALDIKFDLNVHSSVSVPIPGFSYRGIAGVFITIDFNDVGGTIELKIKLAAKFLFYHVSTTVLHERLPLKCNIPVKMASNASITSGGVAAIVTALFLHYNFLY